MVVYQIMVAGKQRGEDYTSESRAIQNAGVIARANKRVHVWKVENGTPVKNVAMWVDGKRHK